MVEIVQAEPVGDRRVDFHGFARDAFALVDGHGIERAHVVQPVGQLDQDDAHIARHRQQHLAEILCLGILSRFELDLVQFAQAVDQFRDRFAEFFGDIFGGDFGVLDNIVQQRGDDSLRIDVQRGKNAGYRDRMGEVGVAGLAHLPLMRRAAEIHRDTNVFDILGFKIGGEFLYQ